MGNNRAPANHRAAGATRQLHAADRQHVETDLAFEGPQTCKRQPGMTLGRPWP